MTVEPLAFGPALARLLAHRDLAPAELAAAAHVPESKVTSVLDGARPTGALLRALAPALGLRTDHLFVLAEVRVPVDLLPLEAKAGWRVRWAVFLLVGLRAADRAEVLAFARSLPQQERTVKPERPRGGARWKGAGGKVVRMALHSNLDLFGMGYTVMVLTPSDLSPSSFGMIGQGDEELTPRKLTHLAVLLGMDPMDLSALTGIALPEPPPPPGPEVADAVALIWECHRLTKAQATHVEDMVKQFHHKARDQEAETPQG